MVANRNRKCKILPSNEKGSCVLLTFSHDPTPSLSETPAVVAPRGVGGSDSAIDLLDTLVERIIGEHFPAVPFTLLRLAAA